MQSTTTAFPTLKADFVMANPPFNQSEWATPAVLKDARWTHGVPSHATPTTPGSNTSSHHLAPNGRAGFVMANGSLTTLTGGEPRSRRRRQVKWC